MKDSVLYGIIQLSQINIPKRGIILYNQSYKDMRYYQSLLNYAEKYGVSRASRKYDNSRSACWDGSMESLASRSRRPHAHPNQHTQSERKLIRDLRRRNPAPGMIKLWYRLKQRGYNSFPMRPLHWLSPNAFIAQFV